MQIPAYQFIVKSLLAGVLIGFGCVIYVASPIKYVGTFLFSLGLMTVIIKGYYLYTGKVGDWVPSTTFKLLAMFFFNAIGCAATAYLFTLTRIDLSHAHEVAQLKLNDTMFSSFMLAVGCGSMMHIAYYNFKKCNHPLYVIIPVMFFMLAGFEHSVADTGFFAMAKVDMNLEDWSRLALIILGNGVGAWIFTKFLPMEDDHSHNTAQTQHQEKSANSIDGNKRI